MYYGHLDSAGIRTPHGMLADQTGQHGGSQQSASTLLTCCPQENEGQRWPSGNRDKPSSLHGNMTCPGQDPPNSCSLPFRRLQIDKGRAAAFNEGRVMGSRRIMWWLFTDMGLMVAKQLRLSINSCVRSILWPVHCSTLAPWHSSQQAALF